ncbi:SDR family oxidoreductase [Chelatococcus sp. GCM10030263]|uniref:SDR family oxidoreductase n=1 Tax=Chelatococcus sp. GCM10030263 TaxID=3273387 RepID=UPI00360EC2DF
MTKQFAGKVVLVSGGSRGIGFGIGQAFASAGAEVVLAASSEQTLAAAAAAVAAKVGRRPATIAADLRAEVGCRAVFEEVMTRYSGCDILVNSAGATKAGDFLALPDNDWQDGFDLKFFACVRLCRLFWPVLAERHGHVVNIIGGAARTPDPGFLIGGSVNAAMANFTKGLAGLGKRAGVNVNAIYPGMTETERVEQLFEQRARAAGKSSAEIRQELIAREGLQRLGRPEDIAALTLFLCGEEARHIQGVAIAVDGGATPGLY